MRSVRRYQVGVDIYNLFRDNPSFSTTLSNNPLCAHPQINRNHEEELQHEAQLFSSGFLLGFLLLR